MRFGFVIAFFTTLFMAAGAAARGKSRFCCVVVCDLSCLSRSRTALPHRTLPYPSCPTLSLPWYPPCAGLRYLVAICKDLGQPFEAHQAKLVRLERAMGQTTTAVTRAPAGAGAGGGDGAAPMNYR